MLSNERARRILRGWTRIVIRRASLVLFVSLAMTVMLAVYAVLKLGLTTDTADMIAEDLPWRQDFIHFRDQFPQRFRTVIVVVSAETQALADNGVGYRGMSIPGLSCKCPTLSVHPRPKRRCTAPPRRTAPIWSPLISPIYARG